MIQLWQDKIKEEMKKADCRYVINYINVILNKIQL